MFEVFCCPSTTMKHTSIGVKRGHAVAHRGAGVFQARLRLRNSCRKQLMDRLQSVRNAAAQLIFKAWDHTVVSLPPRLCTWLPGLRSSARVTPQRTSTTALFDYISAGRSTHRAFYHWRSHLSSNCCIGLEHSAGVGRLRRCKFSAAD